MRFSPEDDALLRAHCPACGGTAFAHMLTSSGRVQCTDGGESPLPVRAMHLARSAITEFISAPDNPDPPPQPRLPFDT